MTRVANDTLTSTHGSGARGTRRRGISDGRLTMPLDTGSYILVRLLLVIRAGPALAAAAAVCAWLPSFSASAAAVMPTCEGVAATIVGTRGADRIYGTRGRDVIVARRGNDAIYSGYGADIVCMGDGNDVVYSGPGRDHIFDGRGNDIVLAGRDADSIVREAGANRLWGEAGNDRIENSVDFDRFPDMVVGGTGRDRVWLLESRPDLLPPPDQRDRIYGGPQADDLDAAWAGVIDGGLGDDKVGDYPSNVTGVARGGGGDDWIFVTGRAGIADSAYGGSGRDRVEFAEVESSIAIDVTAGTVQFGSGSLLPIRGFEEYSTYYTEVLLDFLGSDADEELWIGVPGAQIVARMGGGDDSVLNSGESDDTVDGGDGNDSADLGGGNDTCTNVELGPC